MARKRHTEEEDWWPDALAMFVQLAAEGNARAAACQEVASSFPVTQAALVYVAMRGSIPAYPAKDKARAKAWQSGEPRYEGRPCRKHGTRTRYSNDGNCVECMRAYREALDMRRQSKAPVPPSSID